MTLQQDLEMIEDLIGKNLQEVGKEDFTKFKMYDIVKKQQKIIAELKTIIEYNDSVKNGLNDEFHYKTYMKDFIEMVKNRIKEMEEFETDSN